jgi:hypothetical protein
MAIKYSDQATDVNLGDRVAIRVWFRRRVGRVVYVPGISALNPELEFNGMRWVGIRLENSALLATPVLSKVGALKKKVRFIARDTSACVFIIPDSREFEEHSSGVAL